MSHDDGKSAGCKAIKTGNDAGSMNDPVYCLRRAQEFWAKAKATTNWPLKSTFEAAAREFERRARELEIARRR